MIATPWRWQFPECTAGTTIAEQLVKMESELREIVFEYAQYCMEPSPDTLHRMTVEAMDYLHAGETLIHELEKMGADLDAAKREVIRKNDARGYYGGAE